MGHMRTHKEQGGAEHCGQYCAAQVAPEMVVVEARVYVGQGKLCIAREGGFSESLATQGQVFRQTQDELECGERRIFRAAMGGPKEGVVGDGRA